MHDSMKTNVIVLRYMAAITKILISPLSDLDHNILRHSRHALSHTHL